MCRSAQMLNPIYSTLNDLLAAQGRTGSFPTVSDQTINFVREREQDTRLTLRQPIYAPAIPAAIRAQRAALEASEFGRVAFARRLKRDVTVAYLDWLKATKTVDIVQSSVALLEENLRVNESLFRNGKVTQDQVLRARAELLAVVQQLREARNGQSQARSYLNFLRNHPLEEELDRRDGESRSHARRAGSRHAAHRRARQPARSSISSIAPRAPPNPACSSRARI